MFTYCFALLLLAVAAASSAILGKDDPLLGIAQEYAGKSCAHIYDNNFASRNKSGYYWVKLTTNEIVLVHCEMGLSAGSRTIAWTKIADIDGYSCPSGWEPITVPRSAKRVCKGNGEIAGCYSAHFRVNGHNFNEVYGKVLGYQKGRTTAFNAYYSKKHDIDDTYVDGVSITYGYPRQHLFTYASGWINRVYSCPYNCPCSSTAGRVPPAFVRDFYYCEAGASSAPVATNYYTDNKLWDGKDCPVGNSCCAQPQMPYFYRRLPIATNGSVPFIEVRICQDTSFATAATLVSEMQIFIGSDL